MSWVNEARKEAERQLRAALSTGELVVAMGAADEQKSFTGLGSGTAWSFLLVTDRRVLFKSWRLPEATVEEIPFDTVTSWSEGHQYGRYGLLLEHPQKTRLERVTAHNILWFHWGNAIDAVTRSCTVFRFSRPGTEAAIALRVALVSRSIPHGEVTFQERPRDRRTHVVPLRRQRAVARARLFWETKTGKAHPPD